MSPDAAILVFLAIVGLFLWMLFSNKNEQGAGPRTPRSPPAEFARFPDKFETLEDVASALEKEGLESCNLIVGIDYTASNESKGRKTFGGHSLHHIDAAFPNPYQQVIAILGRTLARFDEDNLIPVFGFGDILTKGFDVFPFYRGHSCEGFQDVLRRYEEITPDRKLSGPTSFAPLIRKTIDIVKAAGNDFHILLIIGDGQVSNFEENARAIEEASKYPIAIVQVGVGDGPWDTMEKFDDELPARRFDNFQFVDFHHVMKASRYPDAGFALRALMEVPQQFKAVKKLGILGRS